MTDLRFAGRMLFKDWGFHGIAIATLALGIAGPYDDMIRGVPPNTNTLVLVNIKAAYASPLAKADKWADDSYKRYRAGIGFVPPVVAVLALPGLRV